VRLLSVAGPVARVLLDHTGTQGMIEVALSWDRYEQLGLGVGENVLLVSSRLRVFEHANGSRSA
jgi:hypothetical protein